MVVLHFAQLFEVVSQSAIQVNKAVMVMKFLLLESSTGLVLIVKKMIKFFDYLRFRVPSSFLILLLWKMSSTLFSMTERL